MFGVKVLADQNLGFLQSRFVDSNGDIINLNDNPDTDELNKYQDD